MKKLTKFIFFIGLLNVLTTVKAIDIQDQKGKFSISYIPNRIVALEYSYVDALAQIGVSPIGVADDNDPGRILQQVRDKVKPWQSVGTRAQPSLEAIAALKPDLIIADNNRHSSVYEELKKIAPTVVFNSRNENYQENLETAQKIGDLLGKSAEMQHRIKAHNKKIADIAQSFKKKEQKVVFGVSRENQFNLYNNESYAGGLLETLGFNVTKATSPNKPKTTIGLEQLVAEKPDFMILTHYREESIARKWENEVLWKIIPAVKSNLILNVDSNLWARARGMEAAEIMAQQVQDFILQNEK